MVAVILPKLGFVETWRAEARSLLQRGVPPEAVSWRLDGEGGDLFGGFDMDIQATCKPIEAPRIPAAFLPLAEAALCHSGPERFSLPYRLLFRLQADRMILQDQSDRDVAALMAMEKSVRRDSHKMKAFVRFREVGGEGIRRRFAAWFEPDHFILERTAPFFARRFADMDWMIVTPGAAALFIDGALSISPCEGQPDIPDDAADELWLTYYRNIFNPARLKVKAMKSEMPVKYWKNLPEARLIPELIAGAEQQVQAMRTAMPTLPSPRAERILNRVGQADTPKTDKTPESLDEARTQARHCTRCDLYCNATQTVFGEGNPRNPLMFVGEQPGDQEDLAGRPFVGPAGKLFDAALAEAGIDRAQAYVTNAVKHFKFEPRGKRRIHKRPDKGEVSACRWWLDLERQFTRPKMIVALGATAAYAVTGDGEDIIKRRGRVERLEDETPVFITIHPSAVLRAGSPDAVAEARDAFIADMTRLASVFSDLGP
ncbi:putative DNA metabolism protein [Rhizobium sp. SG_E_25_P2]|uniref:UdgX family uracil-DNA binding protein n=1 Tax=Rhizobium sp. SG_E_25_P2 TaxID=2879942 RepID=UPI002475236B|nr:UdgX family uracil-DNA binding protein [Rhizobium sp. SG_E_25_P2]MDH6265577.1 putative DNA metabolism protein [Rhizobium sp. SG_E_25_P2]